MKLFDDYSFKAFWNYNSRTPKSILQAVLSDGSLCMFFFRSMSFLNRFYCTKLLAALVGKLNIFFCGTVIGRNAQFGKRLVILHSVGIVINSKVKGGENICIESGVVIGEEKGHCPILGSNIFIGSGAKIFGNITIGNNVKIGANAVVNKSVPDNVTVAGIPARIVKEYLHND